MLTTTHCPKCGHEFEQLRTNKLDHLVLAHRLRGIVSPYAIGADCPKCDRDCSDITQRVITEISLLGTDDSEEGQIEDSETVYETCDSDEFVTQVG